MTEWLTSDHHFGHANIIGFTDRPHDTVEQMNVDLMARWNVMVAPEDTVWVLGDFVFHNRKPRAEKCLKLLHGTKHLIIGNHDYKVNVEAPGWASYQKRAFLTRGGKRLFLIHNPAHVGNQVFDGVVHGHVHGPTPMAGPSTHRVFDQREDAPYFDVGVDANGYYPVAMEEVLCKMFPT